MKPGDDPLIGRHFHSTAAPIEAGANGHRDAEVWQGVVLGCPQPGFYLVQLLEFAKDTRNIQRLVRIEQMLSWQFYENKNDMTNEWTRSRSQPPWSGS